MGDVFVSGAEFLNHGWEYNFSCFTASDPAGELTSRDILTGVSLYYLSQTFLSSVFLYANNGLESSPRKARNDAPLGYGNFKWENVYACYSLVHSAAY